MTAEHLRAAAAKAAPSLPLQERLRLEAIYAGFRGEPGPSLTELAGASSANKGKGKRATLA